MTNPVPPSVVEAFYQAYADRDVERIAQFLDDDVQWTVSGPVDLLRYCGTRHCKAPVLDMFGPQVLAVFRTCHIVPDMLLVDGERAAALSRLVAVKPNDDRTVSYRAAQFMRFRSGKLIEFCAVIDSFNAVEQVLGHAIGLGEGQPAATDGDLVAV